MFVNWIHELNLNGNATREWICNASERMFIEYTMCKHVCEDLRSWTLDPFLAVFHGPTRPGEFQPDAISFNTAICACETLGRMQMGRYGTIWDDMGRYGTILLKHMRNIQLSSMIYNHSILYIYTIILTYTYIIVYEHELQHHWLNLILWNQQPGWSMASNLPI